jgi:CheY-like chemotaxis protein
MIVEDDPLLVEIYQKKLTDEGFELKIASDGKSAIETATSFQPSVMLLDIVLPDMDGFEILEAFSKDPNIQNIPIYVFSNLSSREDMDRATALGAKGFITKSNFTPTQLVNELKKILVAQGSPVPDAKPITAEAPATQLGREMTSMQPKNPNGSKVLIIEDEDVFIEMFSAKLAEDGFEVVAAKNGRWGLAEAEKGEFGCILLDMMMPAMNGFEAIQELRANDKTKSTPVIILSNSAMDSEVKKAMDLGANDYYIKTQITPGEVSAEVQRLISEAKKA